MTSLKPILITDSRRSGSTLKPILITGSHRSGSTWVGKMIASSASVGYIQEPFNLHLNPGICSAKFDYWFTYVTQENEAHFLEPIQKTMNFFYDITGAFDRIRSPKDILRRARDYSSFIKYRLSGVRPLFKDPIAVFSAEWLASRFDMDIVVVIRHPAAFASSLKIKNWKVPFSHLAEQPLLLRDHLYPFAPEIKKYAEEEQDIVDQAALLWKIIHYVIAQYQETHPKWIFIRHEDLSLDPLTGFQTLFKQLDLEFSSEIKATIVQYTNPDNPSELTETRPFELKRDSKSNIRNWQTRLSGAEIERIRNQVEEVSSKFYSDDDWN